MRAVCWHASKDVRVEDVPAPQVLNPRDAIVRVSSTAICGSDLHLFNGVFPGMKAGDVLGHEFMGEVVAVGSGVTNLREGDRVVVPCVISCGSCFYCKRQLFSCCDNSNPNAAATEEAFGNPMAGLFGYSHLTGGYAGGQAELVRVPFADFGPVKLPKDLPDEKVLFISDILPTAWMGAEYCNPQPGDTIAVWGCGPVGLLAILSLKAMGVERVFAIDRVKERLDKALSLGAIPIDFEKQDVYETLHDQTSGLGPDACLDAVGMEAHVSGLLGVVDRVKQAMKLESDRPSVLREMIRCCRKGGTLSVLGVYSGLIDSFPMGMAMNKGLTIRMSQVHLHRYRDDLLRMVLDGAIDPSVVISHTLALEDAPRAYELFNNKLDGCTKVVLKPQWAATTAATPGRGS